MKKYINPSPDAWAKILERPLLDTRQLESVVEDILEEVKSRGEEALLEMTLRFDKVSLQNIQVTPKEIQDAADEISEELKNAIQLAYENIKRFHEAQIQEPPVIETMPGVRCWQKNVGIDKVGLYIPGGTAPLFSTILMLGVPAKLAGCQEIVMCTPPQQDGKISPAMLYTAGLIGIDKIFKVGGAQAIGALAYGTENIPAVYKIFGPGNQYVTAAKQIVSRTGVAIDMPAGPSEVLVVADGGANPAFVAADLLSQAEHGADSQVVLLSFEEEMADAIAAEIKKQLIDLPRRTVAEAVVLQSPMIVVRNAEEAIALINTYAPEHLILAVDQPQTIANAIRNAGSVFLGHYTPESVGDYASGTNHTLPTNGFAKAYSGVNMDAFVKKITFQELSEKGLQNIGPAVVEMAMAEELAAHARAVQIRLTEV